MKRHLSVYLIVCLCLGAWTAPAAASARSQSAKGTALITAADTAAFPAMRVYLAVNDAAGHRIAGLPADAFSLTENGAPVAAFSIDEAEVGVQVVFALDPAAAFKTRDANGVTRLDYLKQALTDFARTTLWMKDGVDDVTVLTPQGALVTHSMHGAQVGEALAQYITDFAGAADPFPLLDKALDFASDAAPRPGMRRYVVFFSNGLNLAEGSPALTDLIARATAAQVSIYTVFVGPSGAESTVGAATLRQLAELTGAAFMVFEQPATLVPLFEHLADQRTQYRLSYRSALAVTGQHSLAAEVHLASGAVLASSDSVFPLRVEPPVVTLPGLPAAIQRTAPPGAGLQAAQPSVYAVPISVAFPDGHARLLKEAELVVDGQRVEARQAPAVETLTWPLRDYAEGGPHALQVRVTDELGLTAQSEVVMVTVSLQVPPAPASPADAPNGLMRPLAALVLAAGLGLGGWLWLSRRRAMRAMSTAPRAPRLDDTEPYIPERKLRPAPRKSAPGLRLPSRPPRPGPQAKAYLEVIEPGGGGAARDDIEILSQAVRLGRDADLADVVFHDRSVSRLHARIIEEPAGVFRIYDQNSTSGTWVNFTQIPAEGGWELRAGDVINLGRVQLRFKRREGRPAPL